MSEEDWIETIVSDGVRVRWIDRGDFEEGRVYWIRVYGAPSPWYARRFAETLGRVTESDQADDGSASFSIVLRPLGGTPAGSD